MYHHIIQNGGRRQHETPVKGKGAFGAAASPAGLLVTDGDARKASSGEGKKIGGPFRKIVSGRLYVTLFQGGPLRVSQIGNRPAGGMFLRLQPVRDDPVLFFQQEVADLLVGGAKRQPQGNSPVGRNADRTGLAAAFDYVVGKFI